MKKKISEQTRYKSWKKETFYLLDKPQFKNQFKAYLQSGEFEYIFDKQKLILDNVANPDIFVKGKFKSLISSNKKEFFEANPDLWKQYDRIGGGKIEDIDDFIELIDHPSFNINHPIFDFIKTE